MTSTIDHRQIRRMIEAGDPPQAVYDQLHGDKLQVDEGLADSVRFVPTLARRAKYQSYQRALIGLLVLAILYKIVVLIPQAMSHGANELILPVIFGVGQVVMLIGVVRYWRRIFLFVTILAFFELNQMRSLSTMEPRDLIWFGVLVAIGLTSIPLIMNLTPDYVVKNVAYRNAEGQERIKKVAVFAD